jgi:AbrB family looped-hinge helix DNA binding protein
LDSSFGIRTSGVPLVFVVDIGLATQLEESETVSVDSDSPLALLTVLRGALYCETVKHSDFLTKRGMTLPLVKVKTKYQVTLPTDIRRKAGLAVGDLLEAKIEGKKITLTPKSIIDRGLAESLEDFKKGRYYGPFDSAEDMVRSLRQRPKRKVQKSKRS